MTDRDTARAEVGEGTAGVAPSDADLLALARQARKNASTDQRSEAEKIRDAAAWVCNPDGVMACVPPVDADGEPITPQRLIDWLDVKFARHGEEEDKWAADYIRATLGVIASDAAQSSESSDA